MIILLCWFELLVGLEAGAVVGFMVGDKIIFWITMNDQDDLKNFAYDAQLKIWSTMAKK